MIEDNKLDDVQGNCIRCGHPFEPHLVIAFNIDDPCEGGLMKCPVEGCDCVLTVSFNLA